MDRFEWAVKIMNIQPHHQILEIGCGVGLAVEKIVPLLKTGSITAIDRSQTAIDKARKRNPSVDFLQQALTQLKPGKHRYDLIFAFNINLFWTQKSVTDELSIIRSVLSPKGKFYLFYGPLIGSFKKINDPIRQHLAVTELIRKEDLVCFVISL